MTRSWLISKAPGSLWFIPSCLLCHTNEILSATLNTSLPYLKTLFSFSLILVFFLLSTPSLNSPSLFSSLFSNFLHLSLVILLQKYTTLTHFLCFTHSHFGVWAPLSFARNSLPSSLYAHPKFISWHSFIALCSGRGKLLSVPWTVPHFALPTSLCLPRCPHNSRLIHCLRI